MRVEEMGCYGQSEPRGSLCGAVSIPKVEPGAVQVQLAAWAGDDDDAYNKASKAGPARNVRVCLVRGPFRNWAQAAFLSGMSELARMLSARGRFAR